MKKCSLVVPVLLSIFLAAALLPASASAQAYAYIMQWGTYGTGDGQFSGAIGVAVDGSGSVYVVDSGNDRIQKFTSSGTYLTPVELPRFSGRLRTAVDRRPHEALFRLASPRPWTHAGA
jgi:hypothetical protein